MDIALKITTNEFSAASVREVVSDALRSQVNHARIRMEHFAKLCQEFENKHQLSSDDFLRRFDAGELGDDAYLFDWYAAKRGLDVWQRRFAVLNGISL